MSWVPRRKIIVIVVIILVVILLIIYFRRHVRLTDAMASVMVSDMKLSEKHRVSKLVESCKSIDLMAPSNLIAKRISKSGLWNISWNPNRESSEYIIEIMSGGEMHTLQTSQNELDVQLDDDSNEIDVTVKSVNVKCDMKSVPVTLRAVD